MKFSWKILNYFIDLEKITFEEFTTQLILSGFEIEKIDNQIEHQDQIIDLNITSNRKDINCIFNLAKEISIIFNLPFKIKIIGQNFNNIKNTNKLVSEINIIKYIYINTIHKIHNSISPIWLQKHLISYEIKSLSLLNDIQEYIKIKWGHRIVIFDLDELNKQTLNHDLFELAINRNESNQMVLLYDKKELIYFHELNKYRLKQLTNKTKNILLCLFFNKNDKSNSNNLLETLYNAYHETTQLINTFGYGLINKPYKKSYFNLSKQKKITIKHYEIKSILGNISYKQNKLISHKEIIYSLNKLKFNHKYFPQYKISQLIIPENRESDLSRSIDIIEEVGRIYGFQNFLNKIPSFKRIGKISIKLFYIQKIRKIFRNLGINEVINTSLINKKLNNKFQISIYNSLTLETKCLRLNILYNLIQNYKYNIKQKNLRTEIFEIGKIFYKNLHNKYTEEIHLTGLIQNPSFIRANWSDVSSNPNLFHIKGLLEIFFNGLNAQIKWKNFEKEQNSQYIESISQFLDTYKKIGIYSSENNEFIGFLSELNSKYLIDTSEYNHPIYVFDINLDKLLKTINLNKHFKHIIKNYSIYPSVSRDISFKLTKKVKIDSIKKLILKESNEYIESINIINEYNNKNKNSKIITKSICLRIVYRSNNKTLNYKDLERIDNNIKNLLN